MNRREVLTAALVLPLIPYIGTKYKTPPMCEPFEKLVYGFWEEYPFDEFQKGDIVRRIREPTYVMKISSTFPSRGLNMPAGFIGLPV